MNPHVMVAILFASLLVPTAQSQANGSPSPIVSIDRASASAGTGDLIHFNSTITNRGATSTPSLLVFLSIVDLKQGAPMDLEDWTSKRSETVATLAPGASATQTWTIRAIIQGDYSIHVLVLANEPSAAASPLGASSLLAMHVTQRTNLNPAGVTPTLLGVPIVILVAFGLTQAARRKQIAIPKKERLPR